MAKQLNLHSFFAQKNPSKIQVNPRDKYVVRDLMNDLISQVEKNERRKPKRKNNNENDTVMTTEKVTIWKKEFTFWNTEDGKVIFLFYIPNVKKKLSCLFFVAF